MNRIIATLLSFAAFTTAMAGEPVRVRTVAIVQPVEPTEYEVTVKSSVSFLIPLAATATHFDSKKKTQTFTELIKAQGGNFGEFFSERVAEKLVAAGYQVKVLSEVTRPPKSPDSVDYEALDFSEDIALHLRLDAIGFYSGFGSSDYVPKVNVSGISFTRKGKDYPYEGNLHFGVDARAGKDWAIASTKEDNFPSFDALIAEPKKADAIVREALTKLAERLVLQFKAASPPH